MKPPATTPSPIRSRFPLPVPSARGGLALALALVLLGGSLAAAVLSVEAGEAAEDLAAARERAAAGQVSAAVEALEPALGAGTLAAAAVLADPALAPLRGDAAFRALVCEHATGAELPMVSEGEPGWPLRLELRVVDGEGRPAAGAPVYAYQTDADGRYTREGDDPGGGDSRNPRLFACGRTGADGRVRLVTVRPGGYPNGRTPQHVHYEIGNGDHRHRGEVFFSDDPRPGKDVRAFAARRGFPVVTPEPAPDGTLEATAEVRLE